MKRKIFVFDLDGTLCKTTPVGQNNMYMDAIPYKERIEAVNKLFDEGYIIIIETARGCGSGRNWYQDTLNQLIGWGLNFHTLRTGVKFGGDYFIDDRSIQPEQFFENIDDLT